MPNKEDLIREKTFKDDGFKVGQRVYYTLHEEKNPELQQHRTLRAFGLLLERLHNEGVLSEEALDEILLESTF